MTDAGYRNTWFSQVKSHDWFWLGRARGEVSFQLDDQQMWRSNKSLYPKATNKPKFIGEVKLAKKSPLRCNIHLFKAKEKGRKTNAHQKLVVITLHKRATDVAAKSRGYLPQTYQSNT